VAPPKCSQISMATRSFQRRWRFSPSHIATTSFMAVEKDGAVELYPKNVHRTKSLDIHQTRVGDQLDVILISLGNKIV
jgi:hypothetical protein